MSSEATKETELELVHVLFIDIVGFSKRLINEQRALLDTSTELFATRARLAGRKRPES